MSGGAKIKVAHVVCVLPPYGGGLGTAAHQVANCLNQADFEVTVFTINFNTIDNQVRNYKVVGLWPLLKFGHGALLPQLVWRLWKFDVVHLHYPFFGASFWVNILKRLRGKRLKLIVTYHQDLILSGWRSIYYRINNVLFLPRLLASADKIVISSEDYIENSIIQNFYFSNLTKFVEIPFAVDDAFRPLPKNQNLLGKYDFTINDNIVLFVGGLDSAHYFKGVNFLIKAIELIADKKVKALIVGDGSLREQYETQVNDLGLNNRVKFAGYVAENMLVEYYNLGDIFVLPSINKNEAFGIVLIEAMACGLPVIASNLKGVRGVVEPGINGVLVEPKNSRDLANKIELIFGDEQMAKRFSNCALETVNKRYRQQTVCEKFESLYRNITKL